MSLSLAAATLAIVEASLNHPPSAQADAARNKADRSLSGTDWTVGGPCGATIQACIDNASVLNGDRILIPAGRYTESLTLDKALHLIGDGAQTTIIYAIPDNRVMTITGSSITSTVVVSGVTVTGGRLTGFPCPGPCGAGMFVTGTLDLIVQDCIIVNNSLDFIGAGVYVATNASLMLSNVEVVSNTSNFGAGSGVYALGPVTVIGGRFETNEGNSALLVNNTLMISGTVFASNTHLGAVRATGSVTITSSRFERNHNASMDYLGGGGVYVSGTLMLRDTIFVSNTASTGGGGLAVSGDATIEGSRFEQNASDYIGGALLHGGGTLSIQSTEFVSNVSEYYGGAVRAEAPLTITGGTFENNWLGKTNGLGSGGAIWALDDLAISGTRFISNSAPNSGGAIAQAHIFEGPLGNGRIVNALFADNRAGDNGSALVLASRGSVVILHTTIADTNLNAGQAIAAFSTTVGITNSIIASHTIGISNTGGTIYQDYNLFFGNVLTQAGTVAGGSHSLNGNPGFVDPASHDYHIISTSLAIDRGADAGVATDLDGNLRPFGSGFDIGAYEFWLPLDYHILLPLVLKNQ